MSPGGPNIPTYWRTAMVMSTAPTSSPYSLYDGEGILTVSAASEDIKSVRRFSERDMHFYLGY
jgi:hypothetical protein